jgi:hypothetical protein
VAYIDTKVDTETDAKVADLTSIYPTKKRGIIWLIASLIVLGMAGFFTFMIFVLIGTKLLASLHTLFLVNNLLTGIEKDFPVFFTLLGLSFLAYIGVWYGVLLITASYKKYSFKKARILAMVLAVATLGLTYGLLAVFS